MSRLFAFILALGLAGAAQAQPVDDNLIVLEAALAETEKKYQKEAKEAAEKYND